MQYDEPNDSKALKINTFKFAIQNSQIAIQKMILRCKKKNLHSSFAMQNLWTKSFPEDIVALCW